jgi:hypothetical protein
VKHSVSDSSVLVTRFVGVLRFNLLLKSTPDYKVLSVDGSASKSERIHAPEYNTTCFMPTSSTMGPRPEGLRLAVRILPEFKELNRKGMIVRPRPHACVLLSRILRASNSHRQLF